MKFDITSPGNERIKQLVRLRERTRRDTEGRFLVEGQRLLTRALAAGLEPIEIYCDGSVPVDATAPVTTVEPTVLAKASYRKKSQGVIAVFDQFRRELEEIELGQIPLLVATESVEKPGNLGAIVRTADAAGADAVVDVSGATDLFNPNLLRASTGAIFTTPLTSAPLDDLAGFCSSRSMMLAVADPGGDTSLFDLDLTRPTCIVVGSEDTGVSTETAHMADVLFSIPMRGSVDSLNVSTTVAVTLFETVRQRSPR